LRLAALIFFGMKRAFVFSGVVLPLLAWSANAQEAATNTSAASAPTPAAAIAARQAADERYERMAADIQALQAANDALQTKITAMAAEIQDLRNQQLQAASNSTVQDQLKVLADKIAEVDRKREEDQQAIAEEIRKSMSGLEKSLTAPVSNRTPARPPPETAPATDGKGFLYTIQTGDNLSLIVKTYNEDFKSKGLKTITLKQAEEANPDVDWNRLRVGQKIIIPRPDKD
jgi:cell division protein FtsB